jgi:hypothetical protein
MLRFASLIAAALVLLSACGDEGEERVATSTDLTVTVRPSGPDGPAQTRKIQCAELGMGASGSDCRRLGSVSADQLKPVPRLTACTEIYGGPATALVRGTLRGQPVDARFDRTNGCEIARWDRNRALLGEAELRP